MVRQILHLFSTHQLTRIAENTSFEITSRDKFRLCRILSVVDQLIELVDKQNETLII